MLAPSVEQPDAELPMLEAADAKPSRKAVLLASQRRQHWTMLIVAIAVVSLACTMEVVRGERVSWAGSLVPPTCASNALFGVNCPGCGLTRSFVLLAHGDWTGAWQMHRLGWLLALATVGQIPYRIAALRYPNRELLGHFFPLVFGYSLIALLFVNWIFEQWPR